MNSRFGETVGQPAALVRAVETLGWWGELRWPVRFSGLTFAAVHRSESDPLAGPGERWLVGCLVLGEDRSAVADASLLAGYSRRAVLLSEDSEALPAAVDAAVLDVGLVLDSVHATVLMTDAGPVVESHPTSGDCRRDHRWARFVRAILATPAVASLPDPFGSLDQAQAQAVSQVGTSKRTL
jgi:hypothetical protein